MYSIYDYAYNGLLYLNNVMRPRHKRLSQLMIYSTTLCQSKCKHCNIWQKPVEHLSLEDIQRMMQSRCVTRKTTSQMESLAYTPNPTTILGIPTEKLCTKNRTVEYLFQRNNFTPILENNQVYTQGYYNEIEAFVNNVEASNNTIVTGIKTVRDAYQLMNDIHLQAIGRTATAGQSTNAARQSRVSKVN